MLNSVDWRPLNWVLLQREDPDAIEYGILSGSALFAKILISLQRKKYKKISNL